MSETGGGSVAVGLSPSASCDLCGVSSASTAVVVAAGAVTLLEKEYTVHTVRCASCGFVYQRERWTEEDAARLYARDGVGSGVRVLAGHGMDPSLKRRQADISASLEVLGFSSARRRILDVGGGGGECVAHLTRAASVTVIDPSTKPPADGGIHKICGQFESHTAPEPYDVVVMLHALEHVFSPRAWLSKAFSILRPGGGLIIEVPFELYTPVILGRIGDWRHVSYFSRRTLEMYLLSTSFSPLFVRVDAGTYDDRILPVVRAVAVRSETWAPHDPKSARGSWMRDLLNLRAGGIWAYGKARDRLRAVVQ